MFKITSFILASLAMYNAENPTVSSSHDLVKAAIIYNLENYIYWPEDKDNPALSIAVLGDSKIYQILNRFQELGADKKRRVKLIHFNDLSNYQAVHILYVSKGMSKGVMNQLKQKPVMVVGEGFDCWAHNLHICMLREGNKYRLKIDPFSFGVSGLDLNPALVDLIQ